MQTALLIVALLVLAASLGSWLFSQWLGAARRASALTLAFGGTGFVLLLGAAALAVLTPSTYWQAFLPQLDLSQQRTASNTSIGSASAVAIADFGAAEQWPATNCLRPLRATASDPQRWFIDNECEQAVAMVLAWCDETKSVCTAGTSQPEPVWQYQPAGVVMTSAMAKPTARRLPHENAPIGATYALTEPEGATLRIRYLACYLADPATVALEHEATIGTDEFQRTLFADQCYARVRSGSQAGARSGRPPSISSP